MSIILNSLLPFLKSHVYSQRNKSNNSFENRWFTLLVLWMLTVIRFNIIGRIQFPFERIASKGTLFFVPQSCLHLFQVLSCIWLWPGNRGTGTHVDTCTTNISYSHGKHDAVPNTALAVPSLLHVSCAAN